MSPFDVRPAMLTNSSVEELLRRVQQGDGAAATELFRRYEGPIRRRVRIWLLTQDPRLRRVFDSMDVCQSVLASFLVRAAAGQYELDHPQQLLRLLYQMARHKLANQVAKQQARRRDVRRVEGRPPRALEQVADEADPARLLADRELLQEFRKRLSSDELLLADRRAEGKEWTAIAAELGGTAEGRRKQLARALDRVSEQLGLE
jgi:RNA polymerase sigma-70 factor (ECF subfamily)